MATLQQGQQQQGQDRLQRHGQSHGHGQSRDARAVAAACVATVLLGTLAQAAALVPPSVFADKANPLNVVFAKFAWGWTSALLVPFMLLSASTSTSTSATSSLSAATSSAGPRPSHHSPRSLAIAALPFARWAAATLYWLLLTQWAFGNPLLDRIFLSTGDCRLAASGSAVAARSIRDCKRQGGRLTGFDVSGHCFLLIHATLIIVEELRPFFASYAASLHSPSHPHHSHSPHQQSHLQPAPPGVKRTATLAILAALLSALALLWYTMLLATSLYFHSLPEKLSGTAIAIAYWAAVYVGLPVLLRLASSSSSASTASAPVSQSEKTK
ncbi:inositol phospholipid synthesis and fat-storage-inducing TM-domain-containing protein [Entophlyctis helioformis]|nr:inositol phospholipid synthesis and fat-storage-inducing TM-domain-containing protein [Entophlyctis helioformis]